MDKTIISWANDPIRRIILGLTIALDGATEEACTANDFDWRRDISSILESVWWAVEYIAKNKQIKAKYAKELTPAIRENTKIYFDFDKDRPTTLAITEDQDDGFEFPLDSTTQEKLRKSIKKGVETWKESKYY
jgi:hypothetical protein